MYNFYAPSRPISARLKRVIYAYLGMMLLFFSVQGQAPQYSYLAPTTTTNAIPLGGGTWADQRNQWLYAPGDFGTVPSGKAITVIYLRTGSTASATTTTWTNFKISLGQPNITALTTTFVTGLTQVLSASSFSVGPTTADEWMKFELDRPFPYDPTKALVLETIQTGTTNGKSLRAGGQNSLYTGNTQLYGASSATTGSARRYSYTTGFDLKALGPDNAGVVQVTDPVNFCSGTYDIKVTVANAGTNQIKSLKINWSKDGSLQSQVSYSGTLDTFGGSGSTTASITLGSHTWAAGSKINIKVWTSNPNGVADTVNDDDTLTAVLGTSLKGTYTVGGTSPDYTSLTDVASDLNAFGLCGSVTFEIRSGTYTGRLALDEVSGNSATNTITFKGAGKSTTTITHAGTSTANMQTVLLNGTDYVTFQDLTIRSTGATFGVAFQLTNSADYITVQDCNITAVTTGTSNTTGALICNGSAGGALNSTGMSGNYNTFKNNTITGGYYGVVITGASTTATGYANGNQFLNNSVTNYYLYGMYMYYGSETKVIDNEITTTRYASAYGLHFWYQSNYEVLHNNINVGYYGIYAYYGNYYNYDAAGTQTRIANNLINSSNLYGIYYYYPYYVTFNHNTVRGSTTYGAFFGAPRDMDVRNNIFINTGSAGTYRAFYTTGNGTFSHLDHNVYWAPNLAAPFYWNGTVYNSLADWQEGVPQYNQNSVWMDPKVKSLTTTLGTSDLHLDNSMLAPYGPDLGYKTDVDGDLRCLLAPSIGGDESSFGKDLKPTAGILGDDTIFVNTPTDFTGNVTPNIPHANWWYVDGVFMKDSLDYAATISTTGTHTIKVVAVGCAKKDSVTKTVVVVNPASAPVPAFIADKNLIRPGEFVTLTELSTGGAVSLKWEITPTTTFDANGNPVDRFIYSFGDDKSRKIVLRFDVAGAYKVCLTATNAAGSATVCKEAYIRVQPSYNLTVSGTFINDSAGYVFDNGGLNGNYTGSLYSSALIAPCASEVYLIVKKFELECGYDYLRIYDGENNNGTPLHCTGNKAGVNGPGFTGISTGTCGSICRPGTTDTFTAKSGKMFIEMQSEAGTEYAGFEAYWWSKPKQVDPPKAEFDFPSNVCIDVPVFFTNKSTGESVTYQWDLDDDMSQFETSSPDAAFAYFAPGQYTVTLIAYNCGGTDTVSHDITVITPNAPAVSFAADNTNPTTNDLVLFSPDIPECVSAYRWRFTAASGPGKAIFVNGTKNTSKNPQIMFTDTGCYSAFLEASNPGGTDSLELQCFVKVKNPYCIPGVTTNVADLGISEVSIATTSGQVILSNRSTQGIDDYQNFVATVNATLESGVAYDVKVSRTTNLNEITRTVWIDWNLDGDFTDAGEKVAEQKKSAAATWTARFTVPKNTKFGATVMRVTSNQGSLNNAVCGQNKYGEYEDYRIYLTPDLTAPVITLLGDDTAYVEQGYSYTEAGATAMDNLDGNITVKIKKSNVPTFDNTIPGTYLVHFDVQDLAGNQAERVTRVIFVTPDATPPHLIVSMTDTVYVDVFDAGFAYPEATFAEDLVEGDLLGEVNRSGAVDVNKVGIYTVTYTVGDQSGNTSTVTRTIIVRDIVVPVITRTGADTVYHEVNTPYIDAGATATDNYCDNAAMTAAILITGNVDDKHIGAYTLVYSLTDCNGNKAVPVTRTVIVRDTKAPEAKLNGLDSIVLEVKSIYADEGVAASDNNGTPTITVTGTFYADFPDGRAAKLGFYTIIYTVTDNAGNTVTLTRTIEVVDTEAPMITMIGQPTANICRWAPYTDAGYTLEDNYWDTADIAVTTEGDYENTLMEGMYSFRYIATDKSGNVGKSSWRIVRVVQCATGLTETGELENAVSVYPNPNNGRFTMSFALSSSEQVSVKVINSLGQEVKTVAGGNMSAGTLSIDLASQASGVYMLHITAGNKTAVKRVIVNR